MVGLFTVGGLIIAGIITLTVFKMKWNRADNVEARSRADRIEKKQIELAANAEARRRD